MLQIVLLAGKFAFLVILYLFIFWVVRSTTRELRASGAASSRQAWQPITAATSAPVSIGSSVAGEGETVDQGSWALVVERSPVLPHGGAFVLPPEGRVLVGRSQETDIQLRDTFVSSRHALFEVNAEGLVVEDLNSTNGTQVNGEDIDSPQPLRRGDRVEIGDTVFRVELR